jgi:hypothetical protein
MAPDLDGIALVDHHAHGILRAQPSLDEFRGLFSESPDPRQWPHIATAITYRRAIRELAGLFGVEPTEEGVYAHRLATEPREYARRLLAETNTELLLLDDGYPPTDVGMSWEEFAELVGVPARPVLRLESHALEDVASAREHGYVALKTAASTASRSTSSPRSRRTRRLVRRCPCRCTAASATRTSISGSPTRHT